MDFKIIYITSTILLSVVILSDSKITGRKLRDGESCPTPGFFGDAEDCRKFYRCAEHPTEDENNPQLVKYTFRCPSGTVFDEEISTCNHPDAVANKPANCQVYDPEDGNDNGSPGSFYPGQVLLRQQHYTPNIILPIHQLGFPPVAIPYGNLVYNQYG